MPSQLGIRFHVDVLDHTGRISVPYWRRGADPRRADSRLVDFDSRFIVECRQLG